MEIKRREQQEEQSVVHKNRITRMTNKTPHIKKWPLLIALVLAIIVVTSFVNRPTPASREGTSNNKVAAPQYQIVLPSSKPIKDLDGWKKLTSPSGSSFYTYNDMVDGVRIFVSQQQLPKSFQSNTNEKVAEAAKGLNATSKLNTNGITIYIGTNSKGPQSLIFAQDNLLITIKSVRKISNSSWKQYVTSLGVPNSTDSTTY